MRAGRRVGAAAAAAVLAVGLAACSSGSSNGPGVTATTVEVGALATQSGPTAAAYEGVVHGVQGYFAMVNAGGGVHGRKLDLAQQADDTGSATVDSAVARNLVSHDHVFALVGVATPAFAAAGYLAGTGTPTFGAVGSSGGWSGHDNLFGTYGSVVDEADDASAVAWMAKQVGATSAAVIAYGDDAQSDDACRAAATALQKAGVAVPVADYDYAAGTGPALDVFKMYGDRVQLLVSCLQGSDSLKFEQSMKQYHLAADDSLWLEGYSRLTVQQNPSIMQKVFFLLPHVPFEAASVYPKEYPGMVQYVETMNRYQPQWTYDESALAGWIAAAQFVAGLRAVGGGSLSQQALVSALNREAAFTAGGLMAPVDWRTAHTAKTPPFCSSFVEAYNGSTVPALVRQGGQLLACFDAGSDTPVASPAGTPGASGAGTAAG